MSGQFAKLFERDGMQVLVTRGRRDDNDNPDVRFKFLHRGCWVEPAVAFKDTDAGLEARDKMFNDIDEAWAFNIMDRTIAGLDQITSGADR